MWGVGWALGTILIILRSDAEAGLRQWPWRHVEVTLGEEADSVMHCRRRGESTNLAGAGVYRCQDLAAHLVLTTAQEVVTVTASPSLMRELKPRHIRESLLGRHWLVVPPRRRKCGGKTLGGDTSSVLNTSRA